MNGGYGDLRVFYLHRDSVRMVSLYGELGVFFSITFATIPGRTLCTWVPHILLNVMRRQFA